MPPFDIAAVHAALALGDTVPYVFALTRDNVFTDVSPGIREFGLWDISAETLRESFPEFQEAAEWCRFND